MPHPVQHRRHGNLAGVDALGRTSPLIVAEEENLVLANRTAKGSAELVLIEGPPRGRKVIARIEIRVAEEFKTVAVKRVGAGFRDDINLPAAEFAILGVKVVRQNAKLGDGIEIGNHRCAVVYVLLDVASVDDETVGKFALSVNRNSAGIQIARGREYACTHILNGIARDRGDGNNARLQGQQIGEAAAVQGHARHLSARNHLTVLCARRVDSEWRIDDQYGVRPLANDQDRVDSQCAVGINHDSGLAVRAESQACDFDLVVPNREVRKRIKAFAVGSRCLTDAGVSIRRRDVGFGNCPPARIRDRARYASANASPRIDIHEQDEGKRETQGKASRAPQVAKRKSPYEVPLGASIPILPRETHSWLPPIAVLVA